MKYYFSLRIEADEIQSKMIDNILGMSGNMPSSAWGKEIVVGENDEMIDFADYFTNILKGRYEQLKSIGIERSHIAIWMLCEYDQQCNMEFSPEQLLKIAKEGITLCISCWEA